MKTTQFFFTHTNMVQFRFHPYTPVQMTRSNVQIVESNAQTGVFFQIGCIETNRRRIPGCKTNRNLKNETSHNFFLTRNGVVVNNSSIQRQRKRYTVLIWQISNVCATSFIQTYLRYVQVGAAGTRQAETSASVRRLRACSRHQIYLVY